MLSGEFGHQMNLGLGQIAGEYTRDPDALGVDMKHDLPGRLVIVVEKPLEDIDHELLRRVVVIVKKHLEKWRALHFWFLQRLELAATHWFWA
jgi:hypothetical protein